MNIALLARVSTQEQAINGHSIGEQVERMRDYCKAMGWNVYKEYIDAGFSGANTDRPALQRMIRDIKAGKIDKVLVYKLDRLSRSQKDTLELIEDVFLKNNTDFVSMSENFDTSTPFGRAMIGILAVFAQLEREQIKERMSMGKLARAKKGKFGGSSQVPIGYDYVDGHLVTNEFEKMQVVQAFELYAQGVAPYTIAKQFNESGMTTKYGKWYDQTIRKLLMKKTYLGFIPYHDEIYQGEHEAFISQELFDKVQEILKRKSEEHQKYNRRLGRANSYLGGYLYCARCGAKFSKVLAGQKTPEKDYRKPWYVCCSRHKRSKHRVTDPNCKNKRWHMEDLDNLVFGEIRKLAIDPEYFDRIKKDLPKDERPSVINKEIAKIDDQLSRLMDLYGIGGMSVDILQDKVHDLNEAKVKLEHELTLIEEEKKKKLSQEETLEIVQSFGEILDRGDLDEIRAVIGSLISRIEIDGDDVTIHWSFI